MAAAQSSESPADLAAEVRSLAIPAIVHSLLQTLVFVVDRAMLGHHAESSLAAMQLGGAIEWSVVSVFSAFAVGTMARVGRHVGAKKSERARLAALASLAFAVLAGAVLAAASPRVVAVIPWMAKDASVAVLGGARDYLSLTLGASPAVFVGAAAIAALQAGGDTRTPLVIGVAVNLLHVATNRVLVLGAFGVAAMGPRGAGISTALAFSLEALLAVSALLRRSGAVCLLPRAEPGPGAPLGSLAVEARAIARVATPAALERVLYHAGYLGYVAMISHLGDASMAANQALIAVESICFLSADGFGVAAAALVAQKLGAGDRPSALRASRIATGYAAWALGLLGLTVLALRRQLFPFFSTDAEVVALAVGVVPVLTFCQPFLATATVLAESLRGAGLTTIALAVSAICAFGVRLTATWLFALQLGYGLVGVWIGSTLDWVVRTVLLLGLGAFFTRRERSAKSAPAAVAPRL